MVLNMKKIIIFLIIIISFYLVVNVKADLIDYYSESNQSNYQAWIANQAHGQMILMIGNKNYNLTEVTFILAKVNNPNFNITCKVFTIEQFSLCSLDNYSVKSDNINSTLLTTSYVLYNFTFNNDFTLLANTSYLLVLSDIDIIVHDSTNYVRIGRDTTTPTHDGMQISISSTYSFVPLFDMVFYAYGTQTEVSEPITGEFTQENLDDYFLLGVTITVIIAVLMVVVVRGTKK